MSQNPISLTKLPISIVIPTYCEEKTLPKLLKSIQDQIIGPYEVIVADAQSPDKTREIAKKYGCIVVEGGKVAVGRNNGAKAATQEYLLFLDADTRLLTKSSLIEAFSEFLTQEADIASAGFTPEKEDATKFGYIAGTLVYGWWNSVRRMQSVINKALIEGGAFILVKNKVFIHSGGFDENIGVGEDREFFAQAVAKGYRYLFLKVHVGTSTRRYATPREASRSITSSIGLGIFLALGIYAGSKIVKKVVEGYGRLGGGEGRGPNED